MCYESHPRFWADVRELNCSFLKQNRVCLGLDEFSLQCRQEFPVSEDLGRGATKERRVLWKHMGGVTR